MTDRFRAELDRVCARILRRDPMVLYRFGDGEMLLVDGLEVGPNTQAARTDLWQAPGKLTKLGVDLRTVLDEQGPWAHFAIPCPCCNDAGYRRLLSKIQRSPILPANLFINANYRPFLRWLAMLQSAAVISNERGTAKEIPFRVTARMTVPDDGVNYYETHREELLCEARIFSEKLPPRSIVLVSAGPLSEALIFFMWNHRPEHVYVDVGSALDEFSYGRKTRSFMYEDNEYARKSCVLPVAQPLIVRPQTLGRIRTAVGQGTRNIVAAAGGPTGLCLCMIVKNEKDVIVRCLQSVANVITTWSIVDTGSTDGTQDIIRSCLQNIPGELHERPWRNFADNRNEAIDLAVGKASHVLMLDADDVLIVHGKLPQIVEDCYLIRVKHGNLEHHRPHIFRPEIRTYRYEGVVHEYLQGPQRGFINELSIRIVGGGSRSRDPDKYLRDAAMLESELRKTPAHSRYQFYAAQSWRDYGDQDKALTAYAKRAGMEGGYIGEISISLLEIARIFEAQQRSPTTVLEAYLRAWEFHSHRAEPLFYLGIYLRSQSRWALMASVMDTARKLAKPIGDLFVETDIYEWRALFQFSIAADYVPGRRVQAVEAGELLLKCAPPDQHQQIRENMVASMSKLQRGER